MKEYSPYKMKGHTLPGINQRSEGNTDLPDGRSGSSPFQEKDSPAKMYGKKSPTKFNKGLKAAAAAGKLDKNPKFKAAVDASPAKKYKSAAQRKAVHASKNEKASPAKNYKNPQDYKVFNMGNKPTPVKMHGKKKKY